MATMLERQFTTCYVAAMSELQQIIPRPGEIRPDKPYRTPDQRWEEVVDEIYGDAALPRNVAFEHDVLWDGRLLSVQNAHNQSRLKSFGFWSVIGVLFVIADLGWIFVRMIW